MADHQYPCPKCAAVLRPTKAIQPGQKVKCPKCQNVFVPVPEEEEEAGTYGLAHESEEEKEQEVKIKQKSLEKIKDQRPKSSRGPAVAICTGPGNKMLAAASFTCVSCIFSVVVIMWPMFFSKQAMTSADLKERWITIGVAVCAFAYNGFIAYGSVQMLSIASYRWAMMAAIMDVFPLQWALSYASFNWLVRAVRLGMAEMADVFVPLGLSAIYVIVGLMCIQTLRKKEVVAGFSERKPGDI